jgi:Type IV secretion system pilin
MALTTLLSKVASLLLFIIPIVATVSLIIAGYYYILSSGDSEKASQAKTIIKWNLIAIAVALFSYSIIVLLSKMLDGTLI